MLAAFTLTGRPDEQLPRFVSCRKRGTAQGFDEARQSTTLSRWMPGKQREALLIIVEPDFSSIPDLALSPCGGSR